MAEQPLLDNGLSSINRFITDHDTNGVATFSSRVQEKLEWQGIGDIAKFALGYTTKSFPVQLSEEVDIESYEGFLQNKPGITIPGGTVLRIVDMAPSATSPMHRTVSLDYGVVLEGEIELILDSGEKRVMRRGDVSIQRATNHAWRNMSETTWARMLYVLQESEPVFVNEKELREDYGSGMPGVKPSAE
jgi:quercetin dioxygenase-like cupin family protein